MSYRSAGDWFQMIDDVLRMRDAVHSSMQRNEERLIGLAARAGLMSMQT